MIVTIGPLSLALFLSAAALLDGAACAGEASPSFQVDPFWPKPLPNNWILGQVAGVAVDAQDHVWIIQRPPPLTDEWKGPTLNPPRSRCCVPAPAVIEFTAEGDVVQGWGGPADGYEWAGNEHGIYLDPQGVVSIGGNGPEDAQILKFTRAGKFVLQIGHAGPSKGSNDPT